MIDQSHIYSIINGVKTGSRSVFNATETITGYASQKLEQERQEEYQRGYDEGRQNGRQEGYEEAKQECQDSRTEE